MATRHLQKLNYLLCLFLFATPMLAQAGFLDNLGKDKIAQEFLPDDQAFAFNYLQKDNLVTLTWNMPKGYYLYRHSFEVTSSNATLGTANLPEGKPEYDDYLGNYQTYYDTVSFSVPIYSTSGKAALTIDYQGCAASGYCYPPMQQHITLTVPKVKAPASNTPKAQATTNHQEILPAEESRTLSDVTTTAAIPVSSQSESPLSQQDKITQSLHDSSLWLKMLLFLGFGILLAFTPCVLPMIPILSGIIVGQGAHITKRLSFKLSLAYVLGVAVTYGIAGGLAGLAGSGVQSAFQAPWVLSLMALLFVLLALSLFGFYELKLPSFIENHLHGWHQKQQEGTLIGVFLMGIFSALIVSPCVSAPLVGALAYIGQTGDALQGGLALFSLGLGMGIPLILAATLGAHLLPKNGAWMHALKSFFGVLLLGLAIVILERFLPHQFTLFLWGCLAICSAVYLGALRHPQTAWQQFQQGCGIILLLLGIIYLLGASLGNGDPLRPLAFPKLQQQSVTQNKEQPIKTIADLKQAVTTANNMGKPVMVKFSAEWCLSCKIMERTVFRDQEVNDLLTQMIVLHADVTDNDDADKALQKYLGVFAPPSFVFFDTQGKQMKNYQLVAETDTQTFLGHLRKILLHQ